MIIINMIDNLGKIKEIIEKYPAIKLAYIFGSQATKTAGPLSDYDFAVYLDERDVKKIFELKIDLINELSKTLKTDKVDVVVLSTSEAPELKYNIIKDGKLIYEYEPYKVLVEPRILNEYFDFRRELFKNGLVKSL